MYSLGIDLGTNSVKSLVLSLGNGEIRGLGQKGYGYIQGTSAEQDRRYVWKMVIESIREAISNSGIEANMIKCVGLSGQMHGTVLYDRSGEPISNIITWEDDRCSKGFLDEIAQIGGEDANKSGCGLATGFMGPTLYHISQNLNLNIGHALLPTDWLRQELTGEKTFKTDHSNGSSSGFFDTQTGDWNYSLIEKLGLSRDIFPKVVSALDFDGGISSSTAEATVSTKAQQLHVAVPWKMLPMRGQDKETRAAPLRGQFKRRKVYYPADAPFAHWLTKELLTFPNAVGSGVDDGIDALGLLGRRMAAISMPAQKVAPPVKQGYSLNDLWDDMPQQSTRI